MRFFALLPTIVAICVFSLTGCGPERKPTENSSDKPGTSTKPDGHFEGDGHDHGASSTQEKEHAALHKPVYNQILVEFPGHKYALEITEDESTGLVSAYLTDAHFQIVKTEAKEIKLNFAVEGAPKSYTLVRSPDTEGKSTMFTLTDKELATLCCDGWKGEATALVEIDGTPFIAPLNKLGKGEHEHAHTH